MSECKPCKPVSFNFLEQRFGKGYDSGQTYNSGTVVIFASDARGAFSQINGIRVDFPNTIEVTTKEIFIRNNVEKRLQGAAFKRLPGGERPIEEWTRMWEVARRMPICS